MPGAPLAPKLVLPRILEHIIGPALFCETLMPYWLATVGSSVTLLFWTRLLSVPLLLIAMTAMPLPASLLTVLFETANFTDGMSATLPPLSICTPMPLEPARLFKSRRLLSTVALPVNGWPASAPPPMKTDMPTPSQLVIAVPPGAPAEPLLVMLV